MGAPARLGVGVVSAGRGGTALGVALENVGHVVSAATARSTQSRERLARRLPEARNLDPISVAERCELLVLAVSDTALPGLIAELDAANAVRPGHIVIHTAGAFGADVLRPFHRRGAVVAATHPAMTFTGGDADISHLAGAGWAITAPDEIGQAVGQSLVLELGGHPVGIAEGQRALYHAALAHGANHLVTLVADALAALRAAMPTSPRISGEDPDELAATLLGPLVRAALDNTLNQGDDALTGPVLRGDTGTVQRHLEELGAVDPEIAAEYRVLARRTAAKLLAHGGAGQAMLRLLDDNGLDHNGEAQ